MDFPYDTLCKGEPFTVDFTNNSQGVNSWEWDFVDGQIYSGETPPSHTPTYPMMCRQLLHRMAIIKMMWFMSKSGELKIYWNSQSIIVGLKKFYY